MKVALALVVIGFGYGLFSLDWHGFADWIVNIELEDRGAYGCAAYAVVGFVFWVSGNLIYPDGDDGGKIMIGLFWLPVSVVVPIGFGLYYMDKSFKQLGRRIRR